MTDRAIIHVDMDAFYASVECLDNPALKGLPVVVGGTGTRGVVATASYEARKFGIHSALPTARARRLCPQAVFVVPRIGRYREKSAEVFAVFADFTDRIEGLSLDEAFLDVTGSRKLFGQPVEMGRQIRAAILKQTGLTASVGVAHNKFLAKLASDVCKPNGLLQVDRQGTRAFLDPMPVGRLWGIGKRTAPRLKAQGILTIGQLRQADAAVLRQALGNRAGHFQALARGEDDRPVAVGSREKSVSQEITFSQDVSDPRELHAELLRQAESVARRLRQSRLVGRTVVVKIRNPAFKTVTRSATLRLPSNHTRTLYRMARALFNTWRQQHLNTPVRLIGMGVNGIEAVSEGHQQGGSESGQGLDTVVDSINQRFGEQHIVHGLALKPRRKD